jgi:hypothetical protein
MRSLGEPGGRGRHARGRLFLLAITCLALSHFGCGSAAFDPCGGNACTSGHQDCAALPEQDWAVEGYNHFPDTQIAVGTTVKTYLSPDVEEQCRGAITRIVWSVDDPAVASVLPEGESAWVTGLKPGATGVGALVVFASSGQRQARPRPYRVVPAAWPPTGSTIVAKGEVRVPPYVAPGTVQDGLGWVNFETSSAGRLDVVVDWGSVLNSIDFSGYEGRCNSVGTCGRIVLSVRHTNVKPLTESFDNPRMPPGEYTIRIDNLGPGEETVRYEVRLTPR